MQVFLNGNDITNREQLHDALSEALELPEWYGRSLDALYDCLRICPCPRPSMWSIGPRRIICSGR